MKKIKTVKIPNCKKCNGKLEPIFTTEQQEGSNKKPEVIIVMGTCHKCKIIYALDIIKTKDLPSNIKELKGALKCQK